MATLTQKMLKPYRNLDRNIMVACSGGPDSMALLHYMRQKITNNLSVSALFINHGTEFSKQGMHFVHDYCQANNICLHIVNIVDKYETNKEHNWHIERYKIFHSYDSYYVMTGHNLDDQVESYLMHTIKGLAKLIPYRNKNVIRPMLYLKKIELLQYCAYHKIPYLIDPSNFDESNNRSIVRNQIVPIALKVNPGLYKTVTKLVENSSYVWNSPLVI
jgi:tRNA(Ile)-lysidine synthase